MPCHQLNIFPRQITKAPSQHASEGYTAIHHIPRLHSCGEVPQRMLAVKSHPQFRQSKTLQNKPGNRLHRALAASS